MPNYIYETIPRYSSEKTTRFEFFQWMKDTPLTKHPQTGQPVRRVISGGIRVSQEKSNSPLASSCCSSGSCCG